MNVHFGDFHTHIAHVNQLGNYMDESMWGQTLMDIFSVHLYWESPIINANSHEVICIATFRNNVCRKCHEF